MTRYTVTEYDGKGLRYEGFDYNKATKIIANYKKAGIDLYLNEEELDRDYDEESYEEHDGKINVTYYDDDELTCLWGDNEAIKKVMIERIENDYEAKIINADEITLTYSDPGDSGDDATFWMRGVKISY